MTTMIRSVVVSMTLFPEAKRTRGILALFSAKSNFEDGFLALRDRCRERREKLRLRDQLVRLRRHHERARRRTGTYPTPRPQLSGRRVWLDH
jgi:hypothetical protein